MASPPETTAEFRDRILAGFDELSPRLQQVGRYALDEPNDVAFETLAHIASRCKVQPSTIVRFAQHFGFDGATQMQKLLRDGLLKDDHTIRYAERLRQFSQSVSEEALLDHGQLLGEFVEGNVHALQNLKHAVGNRELSQATQLIVDAQIVFIVGFRRAFPVAAYFTYLLSQAGKRVVLIDGLAGFAALQLQARTSDDLVIAISFSPYAPETVELVGRLGAEPRLIAITDSVISPIAKTASLVLQVRETEIRGFRSLAASMCLAQALSISYGVFDTNRAAAKASAERELAAATLAPTR